MRLEFKVPFLREEQIESAVAELLHSFAMAKGVAPRPPVDVDKILEGYLKLELRFTDLPKLIGIPDVLGATFLKDKVVYIDQTLELPGREGRLAFTIAHEIGHWQLHRPLIDAEAVTAPLFAMGEVSRQPTIVCRTGSKREPAEWQADKFAACLLMPAADVRASVRALYGEVLPMWEGVEARRKAHLLDEQLQDLAGEVIEQGRFFNVSNEAMRYRLLDLRLVVDLSQPQRSLL